MNEFFCHEDDYCQIELLPVSNEGFCRRQAGEIDEFADKHRDGVGFTDILVREENPHPLTELGIGKSELTAAIDKAAKVFDSVSTGYGNHRKLSLNTIAFSASENVSLFAELDDANVLENAWLTLNIFTDIDVDFAAALIEKLDRWELLLVDWGWSRSIRISDTDVIGEYLNKRLEVFSEVEREYQRQKDG